LDRLYAVFFYITFAVLVNITTLTISIMVKLVSPSVVINLRIFRTVARQPALTRQAVCTEIVVRGLKCMKTIRSPSIELAYGTF